MARFVYRLQKVYELRERKKKAQEQKVIDAQKKVREVETTIEEKRNEVRTLRTAMLTAPHTLMSNYDQYLYIMAQKIELLKLDLSFAQQILSQERQLLIKAQADLEALVKHKEKMQEEWQEEEKRLEMKQLDEVAGQRYFRAQYEKQLEEAEEEALRQVRLSEEEGHALE
jgi:flagellar export protein FliJ